MADKKITDLANATILDGTELMEIVQGGVNVKISTATFNGRVDHLNITSFVDIPIPKQKLLSRQLVKQHGIVYTENVNYFWFKGFAGGTPDINFYAGQPDNTQWNHYGQGGVLGDGIDGTNVVYNNGASGVGATLTLPVQSTGNPDIFDDQNTPFAIGHHVIVDNLNPSNTWTNWNAAWHGIYIVTAMSPNFVSGGTITLTRAADYDSPSEMLKGTIFNTNEGVAIQISDTPVTIGTDPINFEIPTFDLQVVAGSPDVVFSDVGGQNVYDDVNDFNLIPLAFDGITNQLTALPAIAPGTLSISLFLV